MSNFTQAEIDYLNSQKLGRIATVDAEGDLHVVPAATRFNAELDVIEVGGKSISKSKKFRDVLKTGRAAVVVDDRSAEGQIRGIEIRGRAEALSLGGPDKFGGFESDIIRIHPTRIISWGIEGDKTEQNGRNVE